MNFLELLLLPLPVFLILGAGALLRKVGVLNQEADRSLIQLTICLLLPCLALDVIIGNEALRDPIVLLLPPLAGFLTVAGGYAVSYVVARLGGVQVGEGLRTFVFCCGIQNNAPLALPITLVLFGRDAVGMLFGFTIGVELAFWVLGLAILTGSSGKKAMRNFLNPPVVSIVLGMVLNFLGAGEWIPEWVDRSFTMLGACAIPVTLLVTGALFADYAVPVHFLKEKRVVVYAVLVRLLLMPLLILGVASLLPLHETLKSVLLVQAAMPAAVAPLAIAKLYGGKLPVAFQVILSTTLLGLLTIPLWLYIGVRWLALPTLPLD